MPAKNKSFTQVEPFKIACIKIGTVYRNNFFHKLNINRLKKPFLIIHSSHKHANEVNEEQMSGITCTSTYLPLIHTNNLLLKL